MLVTKQPVFRKFWYPVIPTADLLGSPQPFTLLGQKIVLWLDAEGKPAAAKDRCCHRSAQLSLGKVVNGAIACPYHGWQFDSSGRCVCVPQLKDVGIPAAARIETYRCTEKYGYAWVCLDEPIAEIPHIAEAFESDFRLIPEFYETWKCAGLRVMENELDLAHPTFVHTTTFGSEDHPTPDRLEITETPSGLRAHGVLGVVNPELQQQNLKMESAQTYRTLDMLWFMPFTIKLSIAYANGLVHIIVNTMTPIDDLTSQMVQFCIRNDTEQDTPSADAIAFDRAVTLEDKRILESTDCDVPLAPNREQHMFTDKPGLTIRKKIAELLKAHGETEQ
ncbi:aromatic ring-hydroxylating oxygenase subunit alpha [Chamaesiphon minutus]|uniref:Ring-hydroxylating dioxygenase, large terminal subunit n=1 Tax=Chamaesiphon minutus (strain ATCC 27169 / PCC 6605) TaxID=1173020 RepID=K9U9W2_CHAP6|nr:aromatic ring-hydroxylating dioxygenase subunit alpha [Chamaesiphon minutus]AFY91877.1 ring-hydroxylating dioxygenase, large terminal subunit [Chamaesiphon minutus PCC 6605]